MRAPAVDLKLYGCRSGLGWALPEGRIAEFIVRYPDIVMYLSMN